MIKGAYSEKYKVINQELLAKLKEEGSEETVYWKERTKELSRETNRRRKALEDKKRKREAAEERERREALAQRRKEQQEATQRFQKKNSLKQKGRKLSSSAVPVSQGQSSTLQDSFQVLHRHTLENQNGQQDLKRLMSQQVGLEEAIKLVYSSAGPTQKPTSSANFNPINDYKNFNGVIVPEHSTGNKNSNDTGDQKSSGLMHSSVNSTKWSHFSSETPNTTTGNHNSISHLKHSSNLLNNGVHKIEAENLRVAEQEKLRQEAFGQNAAPKLAFIDYGSNQDLTEDALPSTMGRNSPAGSLASLDSLDEVPQTEAVGTDSVKTQSTQSGIITKSKKSNSATRRRVKFCDSIEFDDGVVGQLVTHEKQSTKHYINLYNQSLTQQQSDANKTVNGTSVASSAVSRNATGAMAGSEENHPLHSSSKISSGIVGKKNRHTDTDDQKEPISAKDGPLFNGTPKMSPVVILGEPSLAVRIQESSRQNKQPSLKVDGTKIAAVAKHITTPVSNSQSTHAQHSGQQTRVVKASPVKSYLEDTETVVDKEESTKSSGNSNGSCRNVHVKTSESCIIDAADYPSPLEVGGGRSTLQDSLELLRDSLDESDEKVQRGINANGSSENYVARESTFDVTTVKNHCDFSSPVSHNNVEHGNGEMISYTEAAEYSKDNTSPRDSVPSPFVSHVTYASPTAIITPGAVITPDDASSYSQTQNYFGFETNPIFSPDRSIENSDGSSKFISESIKTVVIDSEPVITAQPNNALYFRSWLPRSAVSSTGTSQMYSHSVVSVPTEPLVPTSVLSQPSVLLGNQSVSPSSCSQTVLSENQRVSNAISSSARDWGVCSSTSVNSVSGKQTDKGSLSLVTSTSNQVQRKVLSHQSAVDNRYNDKQVPLSYVIPNDYQDIKGNVQAVPTPGHFVTSETKQSQKESVSNKPPIGIKSTNTKQSNMRHGKDKTGKQVSRKRIPTNKSKTKASSERQTKKATQQNKNNRNKVNVDHAVDDQLMKSIIEDMDKISLQSRLNPVESFIPTQGTDQSEHNHMDLKYTEGCGQQSMNCDNQGNIHQSKSHAENYSISRRVHNPRVSSATIQAHHSRQMSSDRRTATDSGLSKKVRTQSACLISTTSDASRTLSHPDLHQRSHTMYSNATPSNHRVNTYIPYTTGMEAWSANNGPPGNMQASFVQHTHGSPTNLNHSMSLDKTPTDEEINYLWDRVRVCLDNRNTQSAGSDSCVNRIDVRHSRTVSGPVMQSYRHVPPHGHVKGSASSTQKKGKSTSVTPTLKRYGSYDCLQRYGSNDSINIRRSSLLHQRAARAAAHQHSKPPYQYQQQFGPTPSRQGPAQTASTRTHGQQPLSEAEMRAVMKASQTNQRCVESAAQGDQGSEHYQQQQYQTFLGPRKEPSALSMEEQKLLESLDRLNERLRVQQVVTNQLAHKTKVNGSSAAKQPRIQQCPRPPLKRRQRTPSGRVNRSPQSVSPVVAVQNNLNYRGY